MRRQIASYIAAQQALPTATTAVGAPRYVRRVGGLALALGLGAAVVGGAGLSHADGTNTGAGFAQAPSFTLLKSEPPVPIFPTQPGAPSTSSTPPPGDVAPTPYGNIGKWMLQFNGQVSTYGGQPYDNKTLVEPVNVIIVDPNSKFAAESTAKVNKDMILGGFPLQPLHSGGFKGKINDTIYGQQPVGINAFSDNTFLVQNDHGRLFGPAPAPGGGYIWTGAFSTETPTVYNGLPAHAYVSFNMARDTLARRLLASGQVQSASVLLDNAYDTPTTTTGDHDGYAVVIVLK